MGRVFGTDIPGYKVETDAPIIRLVVSIPTLVLMVRLLKDPLPEMVYTIPRSGKLGKKVYKRSYDILLIAVP